MTISSKPTKALRGLRLVPFAPLPFARSRRRSGPTGRAASDRAGQALPHTRPARLYRHSSGSTRPSQVFLVPRSSHGSIPQALAQITSQRQLDLSDYAAQGNAISRQKPRFDQQPARKSEKSSTWSGRSPRSDERAHRCLPQARIADVSLDWPAHHNTLGRRRFQRSPLRNPARDALSAAASRTLDLEWW